MNEELIRQCAREGANGPHGYAHEIAERAIRLYHARAVQPLVEVAREARRIAMEQTLVARIPECGKFGEIAQDLDAALAPFQQEAK